MAGGLGGWWGPESDIPLGAALGPLRQGKLGQGLGSEHVVAHRGWYLQTSVEVF